MLFRARVGLLVDSAGQNGVCREDAVGCTRPRDPPSLPDPSPAGQTGSSLCCRRAAPARPARARERRSGSTCLPVNESQVSSAFVPLARPGAARARRAGTHITPLGAEDHLHLVRCGGARHGALQDRGKPFDSNQRCDRLPTREFASARRARPILSARPRAPARTPANHH